jgi:hypothetical protein
LSSLKSTVSTLDGLALGAGGLGLLAAGGALVYLLLPGPEDQSTGLRVRVAPVASSSGGGLVAAGSF